MFIYDPNHPFALQVKEWFEKNPLTNEDLVRQYGLTPRKGSPHCQAFKDYMRDRMIGNKNTLGLKCKPEHVAARAKSRSRPLKIDNIIFESGRHAAKHYNVSPALIVKWIKNGKAEKIMDIKSGG